MYQKIIIIGNLGREPEMKYSPNGAYLRKVLDGWFSEKKIRKVYA